MTIAWARLCGIVGSWIFVALNWVEVFITFTEFFMCRGVNRFYNEILMGFSEPFAWTM